MFKDEDKSEEGMVAQETKVPRKRARKLVYYHDEILRLLGYGWRSWKIAKEMNAAEVKVNTTSVKKYLQAIDMRPAKEFGYGQVQKKLIVRRKKKVTIVSSDEKPSRQQTGNAAKPEAPTAVQLNPPIIQKPVASKIEQEVISSPPACVTAQPNSLPKGIPEKLLIGGRLRSPRGDERKGLSLREVDDLRSYHVMGRGVDELSVLDWIEMDKEFWDWKKPWDGKDVPTRMSMLEGLLQGPGIMVKDEYDVQGVKKYRYIFRPERLKEQWEDYVRMPDRWREEREEKGLNYPILVDWQEGYDPSTWEMKSELFKSLQDNWNVKDPVADDPT